ncbi:MAG: DUF1835 domain-containing protein [Tenacibaculum sp.]
MASSILHITNGDHTTKLLSNLNFEGEIITWREMLCEGKTTIDVGSESFWKTRYEFLKASYKTTKKTFIDYTLKEYRKLCNQKKQDEIVLWFEYDLFCQINMLAIISWLKHFRKDRKISLVCSGELNGKSGLFSLNELNNSELLEHFKHRVALNKDDIEYADYIWQLYCSDCPLPLENAHKFNPNSPFVYLEKAVKAHLQRFPSIKNGLNKMENCLLDLADKNEFKNEKQFIDAILKNQGVYGFSNLQYQTKIQHIKKLFSSFSPVKISKRGKRVLYNQLNFYAHLRSDFSYLGGSKKYSYLYIDQNEKLLKITS